MHIQAGRGYWTIKSLKVQHRGWGLKSYGANPGLIVDGLEAYDNVNGLAFTDADNLLIQNCKSDRYTRYGYHIVYACDGVTIKNCSSDCSGTGDVADTAWWAGCNPAGFYFHMGGTYPNNTNILVEDCVTRNNRQVTPTVGDYEQGDGFMAEFPNDGITFRRCISYDNQQGGWDIKGLNETLENCIALRSGRGFKVWRNATLNNCVGVENSGSEVFVQGTDVNPYLVLTANNCTFHTNNPNGHPVRIEKGINGGPIQAAFNCILSFANAASTYSRSYVSGGFSGSLTNVDLKVGTVNESMRHDNAANTAAPPRYLSPSTIPWKPWITVANAYDNQTYGSAKGYRAAGAIPPPVLTLFPEADTYVHDSSANKGLNFGTSTSLAVKDGTNSGNDRISYLRFAIPRTTVSAKLKLKVIGIEANPGVRPVEVRQLSNDTWLETAVTWNNKPAYTEATIGIISDAGTVGTVYTVDVTNYVNAQFAADGKASFVLFQPNIANLGTYFGSREDSANKPVLELQ